MTTEGIKIKIKIEKDERKDPILFLPEEPMSYEIKKKKKKKKKKQEDPFKDVEEKYLVTEVVKEVETEPTLDPEVTIKVENIEVELDFNDFADDHFQSIEGEKSKAEESEIKIESQNHDACILTFESVINDHSVFGYTQPEPRRVPSSHYCKICHLVFKTIRTLKMHQKRKHKVFRKSFTHKCDYCGMSYDQKNSLVAHIRRKHGPDAEPDDSEERTCDICALVFKGMTRLRMHMTRKHGSFQESFKHVCKECGLTYDKNRSLIVHIQRKHTKTREPIAEWYNCPFCPKVFTKRETYVRHVQRKHQVNDEGVPQNDEQFIESCRNEAGEIACKECPLVFSTLHSLKLHMRRKHNAFKGDFRLKCRICNLSYDKIESLKRHVRRKHDKGTFCKVCNKEFESKELYVNHTHVRVVKECPLCGLIFASQGGLAKHLRCTHKMETPKVVFCNICNEGFHDKRQLKPHLMKVHLKVSYTCKYCKKVFKAKESYRRHVLFKHPLTGDRNGEAQKCEQCPEMFPDEFELCRHINLAHAKKNEPTSVIVKKEEMDNQDPFQCTKCSSGFSTWEQLRCHYEQNHILINTIQCQACGEMIAENELRKHMKTHQDTSEKCRFCEFQTNVRASMTQHMLRHKNATTLDCDFAGCRYKTFYEGAMLKHKRKHQAQGVKLQCTQCPFQTMNKYILKYHEEAHMTGKKRYACDQCDYATILPANLVQHKYKHSAEKRFKCEVCPFATKYNTSLRFHVKKKHCDLPSFS